MGDPRRALLLLAAGVVAACGGSDHEGLGDQAYADTQFETALAEYRLALQSSPDPRLYAKAGQAALQVGELLEAAEAFVQVGESGEDRADYAADGLERVARRAVAQQNPQALEAALLGLRTVAEQRAIGGFARQFAQDLGEQPRSAEALEILPYAAVAASGVGQMDSLMYVYGTVLRRLGRCNEAVPVFESLLRRDRLAQAAELREHGAYCALRVAQTLMEREQAVEARPWFERAIALDGPESNRRAAYLGLGDALAGEEDYLGAVQAYERARAGLLFSDPLYDVVQRRLNRLLDPGTGIR